VTTLQIRCETCGADVVLDEHLRTADCPYCGSGAVVERPPSRDRPAPTFALGFVVDQARAQAKAMAWVRSRGPFAPGALRKAVAERTRGVYVPAWLYGARASADWSASIGEDYTETYRTTDAHGKRVTRTRTRTEWRSLAGDWDAYVIDVVVTASRGLDNEGLESIEPFDLRALRRYRPETLAGWIAEEPTLSREECLELARSEATEDVGQRIARFMPGDKSRDLSFHVQFDDEVADLVLLPVWIFTLRFAEGRPPVRLLINGQTGEVAGRAPLSGVRVGLTIMLVLAVVVVLVLMSQGGPR